MSKYWQNRWAKENEYNTHTKIDERLKIYQALYLNYAEKLSDKIVAKYAKLIAVETPNHAYNLQRDKQFLKQIEDELKKLGINLQDYMRRDIETIYKLGDATAKKYLEKQQKAPLNDELNKSALDSALNSSWAADKKTFSERIWQNINLLNATLKTELTRALATGESAMTLTSKLMNRFGVSYNEAKRLAVTEMNHAYNVAAVERMKSAGIKEYIFYAAKDERVCEECGKLNEKHFPITNKTHIPPIHPSCRCCLLAQIDLEETK